MLIENFYTYVLTKHVDNEIEAIISINEFTSIYEGHFPNMPITPGVCQFLIMKEILAAELDTTLQLTSAKYIKFISIHEPVKENKIKVKLIYSGDSDSGFKVDGVLYNSKTNFLKFKSEFH